MRLFKHPIKKLTILTIFGGGYVLGARAGRERYEQIMRAAGQVKDDPRVRETMSRAEDLAREAATKVSEEPHVKEAAARAQDLVGDAKKATTPSGTDSTSGDTAVHPLLADEHVADEDEVVYSTGPDIEETVDELRPTDDGERL